MTIRHYTPRVDRGLRLAIATLEIDAQNTRSELEAHRSEWPAEHVRRELEFIEDASAAAQWLRYQRVRRQVDPEVCAAEAT